MLDSRFGGACAAYHFLQAARCYDIAGVNQAVQMPSRLLNLLTHLILTFELKDIRDEVQSVLIVRYFSIKTSKIESIRQVFLVDLAKVFIASGRYKLQ